MCCIYSTSEYTMNEGLCRWWLMYAAPVLFTVMTSINIVFSDTQALVDYFSGLFLTVLFHNTFIKTLHKTVFKYNLWCLLCKLNEETMDSPSRFITWMISPSDSLKLHHITPLTRTHLCFFPLWICC